MSRRNRFYQVKPTHEGNLPLPAFGVSVNGIMTELTPLDDVNPQGLVTISMTETAVATSPSAIPSVASCGDEVKQFVPKPKLKSYPVFIIDGTPCCGMHTVSGFQYTKDHVPEDFIIGIYQSYQRNVAQNTDYRRINTTHRERMRDLLRRSGNPQGIQGLYVNDPLLVNKPQSIPGMLVFTWNNQAYRPGADKIAAFIKENNLGSVTFTGTARNPNSGNNIASMIWEVNGPAYYKFIQDKVECSEG